MATPTFTGEEYLSALSEFPGGPQGLIDAAVERFGAQGLTATPRGNDFSLYVPGEFMSSGRPMNYASTLANPTVGGGYYDYLYSTPAFKDIYTNILSPTITGFQPQVIAPEQPVLEPTQQIKATEQRPITKTSPEFKLRSDDNDEIEDDFTIEDIATGGNVVANEQVDPPALQENIITPPASTKTAQTEAAQPQIAEQKQPAVEQSVGDVLDNLDFENDPDATSKLINSFAGTEVIDIKTGREQVSKTAPAPTPSYTRANYQPYIYEDNLRDLFNKNTMASRLGSFSPPADAYLKGGRDYISYDGPGGFADIMSKSMTDPRFVSGESVGLPTVTYRSKGDIIQAPDYLQLEPRMNVGDVVIPYAGQSRGRSATAYADTTAEMVEIDLDNMFERVREDYGELEAERKEDLKNRINSFIPEAGDLSPYPVDTTAEGFKFYEHPTTKNAVNTAVGKLKNIVKQAGDGVKVAVDQLKGLTDELTRFVERNGGRGSVEQQAWGPTFTGMLDILKGDFKDFDRQTQGDIQWLPLVYFATQFGTPIGQAIGGIQLSNTIKDWMKSAINVSTYDSPEWTGDPKSFQAAYVDSQEFAGDLLRPFAKSISNHTIDKMDGVPKDASIVQKVRAAFGQDKGEMEGPKQFVISDKEPVQGPQQDPTGQIAPEDADVPFSEAPASQGEPTSGGVTSRPGTETPIESSDPNKQGDVIDYISPFAGQGVSAGPAPVVGSSLPGVTSSVVEPTLVNPKTITIGPAADSPFAGMGVGAGLAPGVTSDLPLTNPPISDGVIPTLDTEFQFVPDTSTMPSPFTGMGVSAGELSVRPRVDLENVPYDVEPTQVDSDGIPFAENIQIDVPRVPRYGATEGTTPFTEVSPRPSLDPVIREPEDVINASLPVDANGQVTTNIKDIVGFRNFSTDAGSLTEMFGGGEEGARAAGAIAAGAGPEYGNPLPKLREQWNIQQTQTLEDELKTKAMDAFVKTTGAPEQFLKVFPNFYNSTKKALEDNYKDHQNRFGDNFPLSLSIYITMRSNPYMVTKPQEFKNNFTEALKTFAQEKTIISDLDKPLNLDNSAILDRMGIRIEGLTNVGTDFSGERPDIYKKPAKDIFKEQFTVDKLNEVIQPRLNIEDLRNHPNRDSIIEDLKAEGRLEPDFEFPEAEIDEASEEFADRTFVRFDKKLSIDDLIRRYFKDFDDDDIDP